MESKKYIVDLLISEKDTINEELRYYASFMFKYLPIVGSLSFAFFGYALQNKGGLIFSAIPLLINIFAIGFLYIDYQMTLLDGYAKILEDTINDMLSKKVFIKNSVILSSIYGGNGKPVPKALIVNIALIGAIVLIVYGASLFKAWGLLSNINNTLKISYVIFCILCPFSLIATYRIMFNKIQAVVFQVKKGYESLSENIKNA